MVIKTKQKEIAFRILIIIMLILAVKGMIIVGKFIGYAAYLETEGGTVSEIDLLVTYDVTHWSALYGTAWGVGWTTEWYYNLTGNVTLTQVDNEKHLLFVCFEPGVDHEIYASMVPESQVDFSTLRAATTAEVDAYLNVSSSSFFSATNTFTESETFNVGENSITVPATYTYSWQDANPTSFITGILIDDNDNIVIVTKILDVPVNGFQGSRLNYQMLMPIHFSTWQDYYVWSDPTDECPEGQGMAPGQAMFMEMLQIHQETH